jgi:hypothetical protein
MSSQRPSPATAARADHQRTAGVPAPSRWFGLARVVWAVTALLALGILVASIPGYVRVAAGGDYFGRAIQAPAWLVHVLNLAGALALFAAALVCVGLARLLVWRKPGNRMALFLSFYLLMYGIVQAGPLERLDALVPGSSALATNVLEPGLFLWPTVALLALFPTGRFVPPWTRWVLLLAVTSTPLQLYVSVQYLHQIQPPPWLLWSGVTYIVLTVGAVVYAQVFRYRHVSTPTERQQTKWAVSGLVLWMLMEISTGAPFFVYLNWPRGAALPWWVPALFPIWGLSLDLLPLTLTVALLRYRLFDIDVLIRRTLVYGTLTAILAAVYFAVVLAAQVVGERLTGLSSPPSWLIVITTLLIAALVHPLRRRLQTLVNRRFYRSNYDAARTVEAFAATLRTELDLTELSAHLVGMVQETMQPAHVSLWLCPMSSTSPGGPSRPVELMEAWMARRARADSAEPR